MEREWMQWCGNQVFFSLSLFSALLFLCSLFFTILGNVKWLERDNVIKMEIAPFHRWSIFGFNRFNDFARYIQELCKRLHHKQIAGTIHRQTEIAGLQRVTVLTSELPKLLRWFIFRECLAFNRNRPKSSYRGVDRCQILQANRHQYNHQLHPFIMHQRLSMPKNWQRKSVTAVWVRRIEVI